MGCRLTPLKSAWDKAENMQARSKHASEELTLKRTQSPQEIITRKKEKKKKKEKRKKKRKETNARLSVRDAALPPAAAQVTDMA